MCHCVNTFTLSFKSGCRPVYQRIACPYSISKTQTELIEKNCRWSKRKGIKSAPREGETGTHFKHGHERMMGRCCTIPSPSTSPPALICYYSPVITTLPWRLVMSGPCGWMDVLEVLTCALPWLTALCCLSWMFDVLVLAFSWSVPLYPTPTPHSLRLSVCPPCLVHNILVFTLFKIFILPPPPLLPFSPSFFNACDVCIGLLWCDQSSAPKFTRYPNTICPHKNAALWLAAPSYYYRDDDPALPSALPAHWPAPLCPALPCPALPWLVTGYPSACLLCHWLCGSWWWRTV